MTLFVNNDNDITLSNLRSIIDPDTIIEDAEPTVTLCEYNALTIETISAAASAVITMSGDHGFANGDRVLVNRVVGRTTVNGKHEVSSVTATSFTLAGVNTTGDPAYVASGNVYKIVDGAEEIPMVWDESEEFYYATIDRSIQLIDKRRYVIFTEETDLDFEVEQTDLARVRTRG